MYCARILASAFVLWTFPRITSFKLIFPAQINPSPTQIVPCSNLFLFTYTHLRVSIPGSIENNLQHKPLIFMKTINKVRVSSGSPVKLRVWIARNSCICHHKTSYRDILAFELVFFQSEAIHVGPTQCMLSCMYIWASLNIPSQIIVLISLCFT